MTATARTDAGPCYGPDCDHVSHVRQPAGTFTDRDLYELMQRHLAPVLWPISPWECLHHETKLKIAAAADEIWGRLT